MMKLLPFLGKTLKSDEVIDLLEVHGVEVTYDFDRSHENMPDIYWAAARDLGLLFRFDESQVLGTIFIYLENKDGFKPADLRESDLQLFHTKKAVRDYAVVNRIPIKEGQGNFLGTKHDWIRFDFPDYSIHYDFGDGPLKQITLSRDKPN
jgi:hypothetical protein